MARVPQTTRQRLQRKSIDLGRNEGNESGPQVGEMEKLESQIMIIRSKCPRLEGDAKPESQSTHCQKKENVGRGGKGEHSCIPLIGLVPLADRLLPHPTSFACYPLFAQLFFLSCRSTLYISSHSFRATRSSFDSQRFLALNVIKRESVRGIIKERTASRLVLHLQGFRNCGASESKDPVQSCFAIAHLTLLRFSLISELRRAVCNCRVSAFIGEMFCAHRRVLRSFVATSNFVSQ